MVNENFEEGRKLPVATIFYLQSRDTIYPRLANKPRKEV